MDSTLSGIISLYWLYKGAVRIVAPEYFAIKEIISILK